MNESVINRAIVMNDLHGAFRTNARRARNVVDRIAHQAEEIDELVRGHAKFLLDPGFIAPFDRRHWFLSLNDLRVLTHADDPRIDDHLAHVFVVRHDDCLQSFFGRLLRQRSDHIVCFEARHRNHRDVVGFAKPLDVRKLRSEILRHLLAIRFVIGECLVTKSLLFRFKNCRDVFRFFILNQLPQHVSEDIDGLRDLTLGRHQRRGPIRERRIKCAKNMRHRIDEKDSLSRLTSAGGFDLRHCESIIGSGIE